MNRSRIAGCAGPCSRIAEYTGPCSQCPADILRGVDTFTYRGGWAHGGEKGCEVAMARTAQLLWDRITLDLDPLITQHLQAIADLRPALRTREAELATDRVELKRARDQIDCIERLGATTHKVNRGRQ